MINDREYVAWQNVCEQIKSILNIDDDEFNKRKDIRDLLILMCRWCEADKLKGGESMFADSKLSTEKEADKE